MLELEQLKQELQPYRNKLEEMGLHFDISGVKVKLKELEEKSSQSDFWDDMDEAQKFFKK